VNRWPCRKTASGRDEQPAFLLDGMARRRQWIAHTSDHVDPRTSWRRLSVLSRVAISAGPDDTATRNASNRRIRPAGLDSDLFVCLGRRRFPDFDPPAATLATGLAG
jgi:hypothetical protein